MEGQMAQLQESTPKIGRGELRRFLSRIKFVEAPYEVSGCWNIVPLEGLGQILPIPALSFRKWQNGELSWVDVYQDSCFGPTLFPIWPWRNDSQLFSAGNNSIYLRGHLTMWGRSFYRPNDWQGWLRLIFSGLGLVMLTSCRACSSYKLQRVILLKMLMFPPHPHSQEIL